VSERARKLLLSSTCLICVLLLASYESQIASAFAVAGITAGLLDMASLGCLLFLIAIVFSFSKPRLSAIAAVLAAISGTPLYFSFAMPLLFRRIFQGEHAGTQWYWYFAGNPRAYLGLLTLAAAAVIAWREVNAGIADSALVPKLPARKVK
jgi:hypothetical protein